MEACLYGQGGFYSSGVGIAGRRGDFITSPEVGPLFGAVLARRLDDAWVSLGNPDPFLLVVGQRVNGQWWGRDSVATGSFLSDGIEYDVGP